MNANNNYAIRIAKENGHTEIEKFLLHYGQGKVSQHGIFNENKTSKTTSSSDNETSFGMGFDQ